jgi:ubiquinone/menaquinone biosynthesis C-methylase UbiE
MGRYSVRLAPLFADFAGAEGRVLDVGAGTGALTAELVGRGLDVAAIEPSPQFTAGLRDRFADADVREGPAESLPWDDATFDAALAQLVVAFMSDAPAGVREMQRVVRPGGVVAICMWDRERVEMFGAINRTREVVAPDTLERSAQQYRSVEEIRALLADAGLRDVQTDGLEVEASYTGFDDFWSALAAGVGPAGQWLKEVGEARHDAVRDEIYRQLGSPAGEFTLSGTAWAARGFV